MMFRGLLVVVASLVLAGCAATPQSQKGVEESRDLNKLVVQLAMRLRSQLKTAGGPTCEFRLPPPNPNPNQTCPIAVSLITVPAGQGHPERQYCIAVAPKVEIKGTSRGTRFINWELNQTSWYTDNAVEFHKQSGIVIMRDGEQDLIDPMNRKRGKGGNPADDKEFFHVKNLVKTGRVELNYLPVIVWERLPGEWELCAAVDPKIVNEP